MAIKTFTAGSVLTASDTNTYLANAGLVYITSTTFTNVANKNIASCFSSTYDWYKVVYRVNSTATTGGLILQAQLSSSGTPVATGYVSGMRSFNPAAGTATWEVGGTSTTIFYAGYLGEPNFAAASGSMDIFNPYAATHTTQTGQAMGLSSGVAYYNMTFGGVLTNTTSYDGIYFVPTASNMTGTITVFGYRKP